MEVQRRKHHVSTLLVHVLTLHQGEDLLLTLKGYVQQQRIEAGTVLSCGGQLSQVAYRTPGSGEAISQPGPCTILSLIGTLSLENLQLNLMIAQADGRVIGGHLAEGCRVGTAAEIILGDMGHLRFSREISRGSDSGNDTLQISPRHPHVDD